MVIATAFWRRLDVAGHDACRLLRTAEGWRLDGTAVFLEDGAPACLDYAVECDAAWVTRRGEARGWVGVEAVALVAERGRDGHWLLNGAATPDLATCEDVDFGFTPATNMLTLRRLSLAVGAVAEVTVAWLDTSSRALVALPQRYERRAEDAYWYESPSAGYEALLELAPSGFVRRYPMLWEMEA